MSTSKFALTVLFALAIAAPARAWHISGKVYCDSDHDGVISAGDQKLANITAKATSLVHSPGTMFTDNTDVNGFYSIAPFDVPDTYKVTLTGLPAGWSIIFPSGGSYNSVQLTNLANSADNKNFLLTGCSGSTTTTTTYTTTTTTKPTTTSTSSTTTTTKPTTTSTTHTTTTTTTTTTTMPMACHCDDTPFLVRISGKFNNEADIQGSIGANDLHGQIQFGHNVLMSDGTSVTGDIVRIGNQSNLYEVFANTIFQGPDVTIRNGTDTPVLPIIDPFCSLPPISCGGDDVNVPPALTQTIMPGMYGQVRVANGATLKLEAGTYDVCAFKTGRNATIIALGPVTLNVAGNFNVGTASSFGPQPGGPLVKVNVGGTSVKLAHDAHVQAVIVAPHARLQFGRESIFDGCFCVDRASTDKHITLECSEN